MASEQVDSDKNWLWLANENPQPNQHTIHNLYISGDLEREFPIAPYFVQTFGQYPNYLSFDEDFTVSVLEEVAGKGFRLVNTSVRVDDKGWRTTEHIYQHETGVLLKIESLAHGRFCRMSGYFTDRATCQELLASLWQHRFEHEPEHTNIYLIQNGMGGLHTERVEIQPPVIDLDLHYNDDFGAVHERLVTILGQPKSKGLMLLHGEPGTGKTTYIKHLSTLIKKDMLILPPYMTNFLTAPEFIPFLIANRDSVLIIEDAERILQAREAGGDTNSVANILNLTDGLLADCLHIQIIATFNASKSLLDKALLRKGRLMVDYSFDKLAPAKANRLLTHLGYTYRTQEPMTLADIFNVDDEPVAGQRTESRMGF